MSLRDEDRLLRRTPTQAQSNNRSQRPAMPVHAPTAGHSRSRRLQENRAGAPAKQQGAAGSPVRVQRRGVCWGTGRSRRASRPCIRQQPVQRRKLCPQGGGGSRVARRGAPRPSRCGHLGSRRFGVQGLLAGRRIVLRHPASTTLGLKQVCSVALPDCRGVGPASR